MSALQKLLAAMESDNEPAPGTYRDALTELDSSIRDLSDRLQQACVMRGKLDAYASMSRVVADVRREVRREEPATVTQLHSEPALCAICGVREARVWEEGTPYCKRCARDEGIEIHGKIT